MQKKMLCAGCLEPGLKPRLKVRRQPEARRGWGNATVLVALSLALASALSGCSSFYTEGATAGAGIAGAALAAKVTSNAAVATGIGLGAVAAARAGVQYSERVVHRNTQDGIAKIAGPLEVGAIAPWSVTHSMPIEDDEHGRVTVSRTISAGALDCKEIVFSVDHIATKNVPASSAFYVASICRDGENWKWASAEPATERWGALQ
ncbi:hypothetical protein C8K18_10325 [Paraburkholderia sp. GV068]|jgi:hypothetical protein|uniref:Uncharacterized protein n=1 Tax=Paraburkholderia graminis (strain ATCC 700544 / DSM 17151 / LMG 18924 / NCIMB 13744 / C4D1M) TaxID=396598 RepID=B1FY18_PARG4|nr:MULTISPECIES: hypothetical protein [Paraburkholderia]EDT11344.1 conserved hypothetical protein [Paraburkholderia graminis C4D1M]MDQ0622230.1 hypothetical protein [Paraburkholderia graminis]PTR02283.1 hypothetical protein C8K19_10325 [Paraburkholderia sp. GV072]PUB06760.1 hypothetical protein C8K18_10325 [Paraburkholderia sp. GV068]CAB3694276.1 hypothetical protein R8871_03204 [Paraburkholderia graminis C4D1M]